MGRQDVRSTRPVWQHDLRDGSNKVAAWWLATEVSMQALLRDLNAAVASVHSTYRIRLSMRAELLAAVD